MNDDETARKKNAVAWVPNALTCVRLFGAPLFFLIRPDEPLFFALYTLCGLTDALDGWLARKTGCDTDFGAMLDSVADLVFYGAMAVIFLPRLWERLPLGLWIAAGAVLIVRLASYCVAAWKFRRFSSTHTYGNKLTGLLSFLLPYLMALGDGVVTCFCAVLCAFAGISSLEELALHLLSKTYDPNAKSLLGRRKNDKKA